MAKAQRSKGKPSQEPAWAFRQQGDRCLSLDFGDKISVETGLQCLAAAGVLREAGLPGVTDVVPSYTAVAVHFLPDPDSDGKVSAFDAQCARISALLGAGLPEVSASSREIEIPVCYGGRHGPDLGDVARAADLTEDEIIALHTAPGSMVFTLGFAPGLPYIGVHDAALNLPRRAVPRTAVAQGSVAIANRQTTIYPNVLPGGWHILGATPLVMFDATRPNPTLLMPGDRVRFVPISEQDFERIAVEQGRTP
ncbi:MAG: 5-oxoprolinase subunit PxpB [Burkholderiaceae bacterium]|nr:5-oxoprolinase subunit PxpB [Burkholderiaceae bacterium]